MRVSEALKVGQVFLENKHPFREIHILAFFEDLNGKNKIAIQKKYPPLPYTRGIRDGFHTRYLRLDKKT